MIYSHYILYLMYAGNFSTPDLDVELFVLSIRYGVVEGGEQKKIQYNVQPMAVICFVTTSNID